MMNFELIKSVIMSALAIMLLGLPIFYFYRKYHSKGNIRVLVYVFVLIWAARAFVNFSLYGGERSIMTVGELLIDSLIHALQTFSMDESYTEYTVAGKAILTQYGFRTGAFVYGVVVSVLNVYAPILGGAILLDILTSAFPVIKLSFMPFRQKFVFSELNEESVALAEDLFTDDHYTHILSRKWYEFKPIAVFTDSYLESESEQKSELFERAKALGGLCIKTDLAHLVFRKAKTVHYFLMDRNSQNNLIALSQLLQHKTLRESQWPGKDKTGTVHTKIFVFTQHMADDLIIRRMCTNHPETASQVLIRPIRDYRNIAINLLYDTPLFLPLMERSEDASELHVSIIGSGALAEELFRAVYWCGQIWKVQLYIHVYGTGAEEMEKRLQDACPELLQSCKEHSALLATGLSGSEQWNPPYAKIEFRTIPQYELLESYPNSMLEQTDYYIIACGDDKTAIVLADKIKLALKRQKKKEGSPIIAPAVFDDTLAQNIMEKRVQGSPTIIPFASLKSRLSFRNVFLDDFTEEAVNSHTLYTEASQKVILNDEYKYWANIAKVVHAEYKLFGLHVIRGIDNTKGRKERYLYTKPVQLSEDQKDELAWMEHRRWNAFMRAQGFICPTEEQYQAYYKEHCEKGRFGEHKALELKYHPCLVESAVKPRKLPDKETSDVQEYDSLDRVSIREYYLQCQNDGSESSFEGLTRFEFKQWDYLEYDKTLQRLLGND